MSRGPTSEGVAAALAGSALTACPYKPGTPDHGAWARAWTDATGRIRAYKGTAGETPEAVAAAVLASGLPSPAGPPSAEARRIAASLGWNPRQVVVYDEARPGDLYVRQPGPPPAPAPVPGSSTWAPGAANARAPLADRAAALRIWR